MQTIINKNILLGISGGIAAYKSAELVRLLIKAGAEVRVVMTAAAQEFVRPLTYQALSGHRVYTDIFDAEADSAMDHIELARWCDLMLVAPASADFLGKMNAGYADNLLLTLCLASKQAVAVAPAMNQQMLANPATSDNIAQLESRGVLVWGPAEGEQACGDVGPGRMLEPVQLLECMSDYFQPGKLVGTDLLLTAGPTREAIDPVRYISNRSSGKMGYAIARAALQVGARVTLVSGPVAMSAPAGVRLIEVVSAGEMQDAVMRHTAEADIFVACAAVSDYRVEQVAAQKMKKSGQPLVLQLQPTVDILAWVSALEARPFCVGFAAETQFLEKYARAKMKKKNLDMIVANQVGNETSGFETDFNEVTVMWNGGQQKLELASKAEIAKQLIDLIAERYNNQ